MTMKVTLKQSHTHAGQLVGPGPVDLPAHDALWLKAQDLVEESARAIIAELKRLGIAIHEELAAKAADIDAADRGDKEPKQ